MKFTLYYDVECPTLDDLIKIVKEIDEEMGMLPVNIRRYLPPTDTLLPPPTPPPNPLKGE